MARSFTATTHNLRNTSSPGAGSTGSIALWIKPGWNSGDSAVHVFWLRGTSDNNNYPSFQKYLDNNVYVGFSDTGGGEQRIIVADTGLFSSGVWANHVFTWDDAANDEKWYINNVQKGSRTSALTVSGEAGLTIGNYSAITTQVNANSTLAEYGEWNRVLTADERAILALGFAPEFLPSGLIDYYRILGGSPEVNERRAFALTVSGTAAAAHVPIIYRPSRSSRRFTTAAPPPTGTVPLGGLHERLIGRGLGRGVFR